VPVLAELWQRSPVAPLRMQAGHALFAIGTPEAHAALYATRDSRADHLHTFLAIKSIIASQGARAFDPNAAADAIFENEAHTLPFVAYLRHCFTWAGFPGLEHAQLGPKSRSFLDTLRKDLLPF
jgi:hypothetical protein